MIHGLFVKKHRRIIKGFVADFCPYCSEIEEHAFKEVCLAWHFTFLPLDRGEVEGHERTCLICDNSYPSETREYRRFLPERGRALSELIRETHPNIEKTMEDRRVMTQKVAGGNATPEERLAIICDVLARMEPLLVERGSQTHVGCAAGFFFMVTIIGVPVLFVASKSVAPGKQATYFWASMAWGLIFGGLVAYLVASDLERFCRRKVYPGLIVALAPLNPTETELTLSLEHLKAQGFISGKALKLKSIMTMLYERGVG